MIRIQSSTRQLKESDFIYMSYIETSEYHVLLYFKFGI
jgi:hypothetical protein